MRSSSVLAAISSQLAPSTPSAIFNYKTTPDHLPRDKQYHGLPHLSPPSSAAAMPQLTINNATVKSKCVFYCSHVENVYFLLGSEACGDWVPGVAHYSSQWQFITGPTVKIAKSNVPVRRVSTQQPLCLHIASDVHAITIKERGQQEAPPAQAGKGSALI